MENFVNAGEQIRAKAILNLELKSSFHSPVHRLVPRLPCNAPINCASVVVGIRLLSVLWPLALAPVKKERRRRLHPEGARLPPAKWWRRGELNPRPRKPAMKRLRA